MNIDKYNTHVRQAISDEYIKSSKEKQKLNEQYINICRQLHDGVDTLPYNEYIRLEKETECIFNAIRAVEIELNIWDKAREICLNIADES